MCGIIGYVGKRKNALHILIDGLKALEYRGYDSSGVAYFDNNQIKIIKEKGKIVNLEEKLDFNIKSDIGIGHTRWATHGEPNQINSHPHQIGNITLVHNGIIENYIELKKELMESGYVFKSETDTEVICALIDKFYNEKKDILKALDIVKKLIRGSYALGIIIDKDFETLYAIRQDNPLIVALGIDENYIASDVPAILKYTKNYILLENGEMAVIKKDSVSIYRDSSTIVKKKVNTFEYDLETAIKGGYGHFMIKEINEQPKVVHDTMSQFLSLGIDGFDKIPNFSKYNNIDIVACGSAYHTGLIGKYLIEKYGNIKVSVEIASEYRYKKLLFDKKTLVIIVSQSGETADSLAALRIAKENNIDTLAIVNVVGSSIAREAKYIIYIKAGCEIAVATTKAYSAQVASFAMIALKLAIKNNLLSFENFYQDFKLLKKQMSEALKNKSYFDISKEIYNHNNIFFIGRGIDYALAMEGSLKLKEISYIHSEAYAAGELKHGTIALIEKDTPVIALITNEDLAEKTISNIKEVKARGAKVILITTKDLISYDDFYDFKIEVPTNNELLQSLLTIIPLQLLSYEIAKIKGCDIDKPRNLAKSVTVE